MNKLWVLCGFLLCLTVQAWSANVRDFGAKGDGVTDDTAAFQRALNNRKLDPNITVPAGVYVIKSVTIYMGTNFIGAGASVTKLIRPAMSGNSRMVSYSYNSDGSLPGDSLPIVISGLTFDGNSSQQGAYRNFEQEMAALIFLASNWHGAGRLIATVRDCAFQNSTGDGLQTYGNLKLDVSNCTAVNIFRGALQSGGWNSLITAKNFTAIVGLGGKGGIHVEDAHGVNISYDHITCNGTYFDISADTDSIFTANSVTHTGPAPRFYLRDSTLRAQYSKFTSTTGGYLMFPKYAYFDNCTFTATKKVGSATSRFFAAPQVVFATSFGTTTNGYVGFALCLFGADSTFAKTDTVWGVWVTADDPVRGNKTKMYMGRVFKSCNGGVKAETGATLLINGTAIEAR